MGYAKFKEDIQKIDDDLKHLGEYFGKENNRTAKKTIIIDPIREKKLKEMFDKTGVWLSILKEFLNDDNDGLKDQLIELKLSIPVLEKKIHELKNDYRSLKETNGLKLEKINILNDSLFAEKNRNKMLNEKLYRMNNDFKANLANLENCEDKYKTLVNKNKKIQATLDSIKNRMDKSTFKSNIEEPGRSQLKNNFKLIEETNKKLTNKCLSIKNKLTSLLAISNSLNVSNVQEQQKQLKIKIQECQSILTKF